MENEIVAEKNILPDDMAKDSYRRALKKNEARVLAAIGKSGYNLSTDQLYQMSEDFFQEGLDKFIFEDFMGEDHCPILAFSDTLLEKIYQKPEKLALGKSRFFEAARLGSMEEKYLLRKERVDDIIIKCCMDGKNPSCRTQVSEGMDSDKGSYLYG